MEKIYLIFNTLTKGDNIQEWILLQFFVAFIGGCASYLLKKEFFRSPGENELNFFKHGLLFSFFAAIGGIFLLSPNNLTGAFMSGLLGVTSITNFITQKNEGVSSKQYIEKALTESELNELYKKQN